MTAQEAIEVLKEDRYLYESDIVSAGDGSPDGDLLLAIDMAVAALEKQIPKKPVGDLNSVPHYRCPSCKNAVKVYEDDAVRPQCHYCNQKLDWGDTE